MSLAVPALTEPPPSVVAEVVALIKKGRPLTALTLLPDLQQRAPHWHDAKSLTTAARLVDRLGASQTGRSWHRMNFRRHPQDDVCFLYRTFEMGWSLGLPRTLRLLEARLQKPDLQPKHRADLMAMTAGYLGAVRDFERATQLLDAALALRPDAAWIMVCKAALLRARDRREEALALCGEALRVLPESGNAFELGSSLLIELGREREAEQLLHDGCARTEFADLRWQLYVYYSERERPDEALHWLAEYQRHAPLLPEKARTALRGHRATLHLLRGDLAAAREDAAACPEPYYEKLAASLARPEAAAGRRARLPVGFVRQNHMTCAPATLAALAAYWGQPAPHLEIAEKICYDGTSNPSERRWAVERRLDGREFRVTPEVTRALVARGVPFTLVTTWTTGAHLQAVTGTDDRAGLLIIRDPTHAHYTEAHLDGFLKDYEAHGPRGMLVLPENERARTDGLRLPEAELYDLLHAVEDALQNHQRPQAQQWFEQLHAVAPGHRLTWQAQYSLAGYDDNPAKAHEAQNALAALFPDDAVMAWRAFRLNSPRRPRGDSLAELERRTRDAKCDPVFTGELARVLADDDRTARRATRLLHRMLRRNPADAQTLTTLARCRWAELAYDDALELYRFASTAADKNEVCAAGYFQACRRLHRAEEGLTFLRRRVAEFGHLAAAPHLTLAEALQDLLRGTEALQVIQSARQLRPDDGELLLFEARLELSRGHFAEAEQLLAGARAQVPPQEWHRQSANLERARGRSAACMEHWRAVLGTEPMAQDAHEHLARLFAEQDGVEQTIMLLGRTCMQWPWHMGLARLYVDWLRRESRAEAEAELRRILAHNPADDWAWRELALELSFRQRHDEAVAAAGESLRLSPSFAVSHSIHALVLRAAGQTAPAHVSARRALALDVNCGAMSLLVETAAGIGERRASIAFLRDELTRQTAGGEAVAQFHAVALPLLTTDEMTAILKEGKRARPDIWETWSTLASHLLNLQSQESLEVARGLTARFPWAPGSWRIYSQACALAGLKDERLAALQRAVDIAPQWSLAARDLSELHEREGRVEAALQEMQRVVRANPLDPANHGVLADMLLRQGRTEEATVALERAVEVEPGYEWGWGELGRQCLRQNTPQRLITAAHRLTASRTDEPRSWIVLVECHARIDEWNDALTEADRALLRWPKSIRLHELRALIFNATARRREAVEACAPAVFGGTVPRELRARQASLLLEAAEYARAVELLEELVRAEPDYGWPRSLLYDVCRARGENARCLELSRDLVRIEPENPVAAGMLAESLIVAGKSEEAMAAVRRALELDPRYTYAAGKLFDDVLQRRDFAAAQELADLMERFQRGPRSCLAHARIALARDRAKDALRPAMEIIESDEPEAEWALGVLLKDWQNTKTAPREQLNNLLTAAVREGRAKNPGVSGPWAALHKAARLADDFREVIALPVPPKVRDTILRDLLYKASDEKQHAAALRAVQEHRALLRSSTTLWGAVSYVQFSAGRHRELVEWCADWKERPDREPWMMANLALALAWDCGPLAAAEVWEEVLAAGASNVWVQAAAGLAFTSAIKGRSDDARRYLENLNGQELSGEDKFSATFARAALAAADAGPARHSPNRKRAHDLMREASQAWPGGGSTSRGKHYRRELEHFLGRNGFEMAFAKLPRSSGASARSGGTQPIPTWLCYVLGALAVGGIRACLDTSSRDLSPRPSPPSYQIPEIKPEQQKHIDEAMRRYREIQKDAPIPPRRPVNRPDVSPSREFSPETPRESKPPELELKY